MTEHDSSAHNAPAPPRPLKTKDTSTSEEAKPSRRKKDKKVKLSFTLEETVARRFRAACALRGDDQGEVAAELLAKWADRELRKHLDG